MHACQVIHTMPSTLRALNNDSDYYDDQWHRYWGLGRNWELLLKDKCIPFVLGTSQLPLRSVARVKAVGRQG